MPETPKVSAADIARLAGVGRAAVSNWRKRHADFPAPVGGSASSPEFDLAAVEDWLRGQGKHRELPAEDRLWARATAAGDNVAATLGALGRLLLAHDRGEPVRDPGVDPSIAEAVTALAGERGARAVFDALWQRFVQLQAWRAGVTPEALAELMAGLADVGGGTVLDPACGTGNILRAAVRAGCAAAYGQEIDADAARLIEVWLALRGVPGGVRVADSLRADAFAGLAADAVVSNLPFGDTNWGHEELGYDPRWEYGMPPRTEPELAWVQHALAHLRPGGTAVLLMPPSAAGRRAGRRIRSELLRRGALRAVIALPAKAAAPHSVSLHLWVLRRPDGHHPAPAHALLVDAVDGDADAGYPRILAAYRAFGATPDGSVDEPGFARAVPVIELLDEDVDLTPARRQPGPAADAGPGGVAALRDRMLDGLARLPGQVPGLTHDPGPAPAPVVSVNDLAKSGALRILGPVRPAADPIALEPGDVVVPTVARPLITRVVTEAGPPLGPNLFALRPDPAILDPWYLAGQLRTAANERQAVSVSGAFRFDVRRAQVRRLPLPQQRRLGEAFRALDTFDEALRRTASLGADFIRGAIDGLAQGALRPPPES
ncbi:N-6 DNA methylase [Dactylosporangium sp. CA-092794]|uniref:N-6 DNA methylase n=1 Tax=Dactylosporangium sp. CA-092794 TaxID=3239929 RepID=UPI003D916B8D